MYSQRATESEIIELERKARELSRIVFTFCENRLSVDTAKPSSKHVALAASAMALQKSIATFLAVGKLCE